jgi:hypothetical protein
MTHYYRADRASLGFHTPPGASVPALVEDFYSWAETKRAGSLGHFELHGSRLDDWYVEDGTRRASAFVSFLTCGDGSRVGWWRLRGEQLDVAPIVMLGSQGPLRALARSAGGFLRKLAARRTGIRSLLEGAPSDADPFGELSAWLDERGAASASDTDELGDETSALEAWFARWSAERVELARHDPERARFAQAAREVIGAPHGSGASGAFGDLFLTGTQCIMFGAYRRRIELPARFERHAREMRERDAQELPAAGLWHRAMLRFDSTGSLLVTREYLLEPTAREIMLDDAGLRDDALKLSRTAYWTPEWLTRRLRR